MSRRVQRWFAPPDSARAEVEDAIEEILRTGEPTVETPRRALWRIDGRSTPPLMLKVYARRGGFHALREQLKHGVGRSPARREWSGLQQAARAGLHAPVARGYGKISSGELFLLVDWIEGQDLKQIIEANQSPHNASTEIEKTLSTMADTVNALHKAGLVHGDLHLGNLRQSGDQVVLLDWQRARALRGESDRLRDLARLEWSLIRAGLPDPTRLALREQLGVGPELDPALVHFLADHRRGRARRRLRIGRDWVELRFENTPHARGHGVAEIDPHLLVQALSHPETKPPHPKDEFVASRRNGRVRVSIEKVGAHEWIRKDVSAGQIGRALADAFRGSAARRAFHEGQKHALITNRTARPLAYLEKRRFGVPFESTLLVEKVGDCDLDRFTPQDEAEAQRVARAFGAWLGEAHAQGFAHRDLKGGNIRVRVRPEEVRFWVIDLEDLSPPRWPTPDAQLLALSQVNASIPDEHFSLEARNAALLCYAERLPFARPIRDVRQDVIARSRARQHAWRGKGITLPKA